MKQCPAAPNNLMLPAAQTKFAVHPNVPAPGMSMIRWEPGPMFCAIAGVTSCNGITRVARVIGVRSSRARLGAVDPVTCAPAAYACAPSKASVAPKKTARGRAIRNPRNARARARHRLIRILLSHGRVGAAADLSLSDGARDA